MPIMRLLLIFPEEENSNANRNHAEQHRRYQISLSDGIVILQERVKIAVLCKPLIPVIQIHNMNTDARRANSDTKHNQYCSENHQKSSGNSTLFHLVTSIKKDEKQCVFRP